MGFRNEERVMRSIAELRALRFSNAYSLKMLFQEGLICCLPRRSRVLGECWRACVRNVDAVIWWRLAE
jgi:hypothetical protein